ncbi:MAG TPA: hypothetical protein VHZ78_00805 [Rhizomicrobium sp.]|jgi:hypothetical protein|nr:hypothetical protein [Rhizomicrobium sp.]
MAGPTGDSAGGDIFRTIVARYGRNAGAARYMKRAMTGLVVAGVYASAAFAEDVTAAVPGHPGLTYETLLKLAMPGMAKDSDGSWDSGPLRHLRGLDDKPAQSEDKPPQDLQIAFTSIDTATIREDGHNRLLLMTDGNSGGTGFDGVLAAFDLDGRAPRFLDYIDAGRDQWNGMSRIFALSPGTDAIVAFSSHSNSNQNYEMTTPIFLRGDKFKPVMTLFSYGSHACNYATSQDATFVPRAASGAPYSSILIGVTIETEPGDSDCGDGTAQARHSKHIVSELYRWDARVGAFRPTTGRIGKLSDKNWKDAAG